MDCGTAQLPAVHLPRSLAPLYKYPLKIPLSTALKPCAFPPIISSYKPVAVHVPRKLAFGLLTKISRWAYCV